MNYYNFHIGDYRSHTMGLSLEADAIFRRLLDTYYMKDGAFGGSIEDIAFEIGAEGKEPAVERVINRYFDRDGLKLVNKRADREISAYTAKAEQARTNGKRGGRPSGNQKETHPVIPGNPEQTKGEPDRKLTNNQEPRTKNQEPEGKDKDLSPLKAATATRGKRLPVGFVAPDEWIAWAADNTALTASEIRAEAARFADYWPAQPGAKAAKVDWLATWRNWIRRKEEDKAEKALKAQAARGAINSLPAGEARTQRNIQAAKDFVNGFDWGDE